MSVTLLKLRAADAEDVQVISAVLQDAIAPVCDMLYQAEQQSFVIAVQRLRREAVGRAERICCALTIKGVTAVQTQNIDLRAPGLILDLLAIMVDDPAAGHGNPSISFIFAGNAKLRLELAATAPGWSALAEDFGEPWPALCNPCHDSESRAS